MANAISKKVDKSKIKLKNLRNPLLDKCYFGYLDLTQLKSIEIALPKNIPTVGGMNLDLRQSCEKMEGKKNLIE